MTVIAGGFEPPPETAKRFAGQREDAGLALSRSHHLSFISQMSAFAALRTK